MINMCLFLIRFISLQWDRFINFAMKTHKVLNVIIESFSFQFKDSKILRFNHHEKIF